MSEEYVSFNVIILFIEYEVPSIYYIYFIFLCEIVSPRYATFKLCNGFNTVFHRKKDRGIRETRTENIKSFFFSYTLNLAYCKVGRGNLMLRAKTLRFGLFAPIQKNVGRIPCKWSHRSKLVYFNMMTEWTDILKYAHIVPRDSDIPCPRYIHCLFWQYKLRY